MPAGVTACDDLVCSQLILGCVHCHSWGYGQQRVVVAQTLVSAEGHWLSFSAFD